MITYADVLAARKRIKDVAVETPLKRSSRIGNEVGRDVHLKIETMQPSGSFKLRGAANKLLSLDSEERRRGVITASTGNHGRAVAYAARHLGVRCVICLSELVPANKVAAIRELGAEVDVWGANQDQAFVRAKSRIRDEGLVMVSPFDDPFVIAGQGTVGLEIVEALPAVGSILVPLSGGGLAAGIALAAKAKHPEIRVIAASSDRCPAMKRSLEAGHPIEVTELPSLADSLGGGIGLDNRLSFAMVRDLVDEVRLVKEEEIAAAMQFLFRSERIVAEGAAAAPIALLTRGLDDAFPGPVVSVLTGDNVDPDLFLQIAAGHFNGFENVAGTGSRAH